MTDDGGREKVIEKGRCALDELKLQVTFINVHYYYYYYYYYLTLGTYNSEGDKKLKSKYKIGYDHYYYFFKLPLGVKIPGLKTKFKN